MSWVYLECVDVQGTVRDPNIDRAMKFFRGAGSNGIDDFLRITVLRMLKKRKKVRYYCILI